MGTQRKPRDEGLQRSGLGKGGRGSAALPSSPIHRSTRFARLNSFSCLTPFLTPPPPPPCKPAEPSPRLEPSSGNSNFVYQSSTFSKDPFFPVTSILSWNDLFSPKLQCRQTDGILAQRCIYYINYFISSIESVQNVLKWHNNQS